MPCDQFTGVKVFSATMHRDRDELGDKVTAWIAANPNIEIVDRVVTQSSDSQFHCITISIFYKRREDAAAKPTGGRKLDFTPKAKASNG